MGATVEHLANWLQVWKYESIRETRREGEYPNSKKPIPGSMFADRAESEVSTGTESDE